MIINDKEYGEFDVYLVDDGTLDTVINVLHYQNPDTNHDTHQHDIRFSQEYAFSFRDKNGAMTDTGFEELAYEAVESYIEQYLI